MNMAPVTFSQEETVFYEAIFNQYKNQSTGVLEVTVAYR